MSSIFVDSSCNSSNSRRGQEEEDSFIISGIHKSFKEAAANLIRHMRRCGNITWAPNGSVVVSGSCLSY